MSFSLCHFLYFSVTNVHFYNGKKRKRKKKGSSRSKGGSAQSHCKERGIPQRTLGSSEPARRAQLRRVTGQGGAEGELTVLTPRECMQVPLGAGPDFPPGRAAEDLWARRDPDICAPSTSSASPRSAADGAPCSWLSLSGLHKRRLCAEARAPSPCGARGRKREQGLQCLTELLQAPLRC